MCETTTSWILEVFNFEPLSHPLTSQKLVLVFVLVECSSSKGYMVVNNYIFFS